MQLVCLGVVLSVNVYSNNTIVTCADANGNVSAWACSGEASPFAAQIGVEAVVNKISALKTKTVELEAGLQTLELTVVLTKSVTPIAHNCCKLPKTGRV
ncbi:MAG: putative 30S ribosomal subunit protein S11 [Candidatus Hodgkinia cicadicola]|nr:MAG: putative 30S ribosomal subunit protein S11 [Candidatus Hodgkinia cicadicola]